MNKQKNISNKINLFITKYSNSLNEFTKELFINNKNINVHDITKFSRNIVTNYQN